MGTPSKIFLWVIARVYCFWKSVIEPMPRDRGLLVIGIELIATVFLLTAMHGVTSGLRNRSRKIAAMSVPELIQFDHRRQDIEGIKVGDLVVMPSGEPWLTLNDYDPRRGTVDLKHSPVVGERATMSLDQLLWAYDPRVVHSDDQDWRMAMLHYIGAADPPSVTTSYPKRRQN